MYKNHLPIDSVILTTIKHYSKCSYKWRKCPFPIPSNTVYSPNKKWTLISEMCSPFTHFVVSALQKGRFIEARGEKKTKCVTYVHTFQRICLSASRVMSWQVTTTADKGKQKRCLLKKEKVLKTLQFCCSVHGPECTSFSLLLLSSITKEFLHWRQ